LNKYEPFLDNSQYTNAFYNFGLSLLSDNNDSIKKYLPLFVNLSENPQYPSWYIDMISMYLFDKLTDSLNTYKYLDKLNLHGDSIPEAGLEISYFYRQKEKIEKAEDILMKYKKIYPKDLRFYQNLAGIYFFRKDFKKVAETYKEALEYDSTNANIWLEIGLAYNRLMDYEKSDFAYEKSILLEPKNALANNNFAFSLSERGIDLERAKVMVLIALEKEPKNPSYLDTYAWILYQKQDFEEALKYIKLSIENGEENSEVYEHLGDILNKLDKKIEALNAYEEGLKINPNDSALIKKVKIFK
jgi:tetratricopeptide (TPR) repeat protein